jgi:hypothetical protein
MKKYYSVLKISSIGQLLVWLCCITIEVQAQSQTGLVHHYSFDGTLSNTAGTHTITGGSNFVADRFGLAPSSYFVQTNTDIISNAGIPDLPIGSSARTVSFWFQTPSGSGNYHLFNYGAVGHGLYIFYGNGNISIGDGVTYVFVAYIGSSTSWRHVTVTYENALFVLYVNGFKLKQEYLTINTPANPVSRIGKDAATINTSNFKIDDLYIYNRALPIEDITTLYTVKCLPDPVATLATDTICAGQTVRINFERNLSVYTNPQASGTALAFNDGYTTPVLTSTTTYYIQSGAGSCVSNIIPVTVPVKAKAPVPVIATQIYENTICGSGKGTLTVEANASYTAKWYTASTGGTAVFTGVSYITPTIGTNTTYYVAHEGANVCASARIPIDVTILTRPVATLTASATSICPGEEVTFSGFENADFSLYKDNVWAASGDSYSGPHSYKDAPTQTSTYAVRVGDWAWCQGTATVTVTVKPAPAVVVTASKSAICSGESVGLTASGADMYVWSTAGTTASTIQSPTVTTTYSVKGTSVANGCSKTASTTVTVSALPTVVITPSSASICMGESATLTASGATTYSWSTAATTAAISPSPTATATYTVIGTSNGCSKNASATVTVKALPTVVISPATSTICAGQAASLSASGATSYSWSTAATTAAISPSPTATTTYTVTGTSNGCSRTASATVTVKELPTVVISPTAESVCAGQSTTLTASGATTYSWSTAATTAAISPSPTATTTYTVTGTSNGCSKNASVTVTVKALPTPTIQQNGSTLATELYDLYQWYKEGVLIPNATYQNYETEATGDFTVLVTNESGCSAISAPISIVFTNIVDYLRASSINVYPNPTSALLNIDLPQDTHVHIFNMAGEQVDSFKALSGQTSITVDHLSSGVYLLKTDRGEGVRFLVK